MVGATAATILDCTIDPTSKDNFLEASFRMIAVSSEESSGVVLVYIPGTDDDGRKVIIDPRFLKLASNCHAYLLGCYFRGEGLPYYDPRGGSGEALNRALAAFAVRLGRPELTHAKMLLVGFSEGGMFAFNYACWHPDRLKGFAALRAAFPMLPPQESSFKIPGLLGAGEDDEPGRIRGMATAFRQARGCEAKWTFLCERNSGHDWGRSLDLVDLYFQTLAADNVRSQVRSDVDGSETNESSSGDVCWFPDRSTAVLWRSLDSLEPLDKYLMIEDTPDLRDAFTVSHEPLSLKCANGASISGSIHLESRDRDATIAHVQIVGEGFTLLAPIAGRLPKSLQFRFSPVGQPWGEARAEIFLTAKIDGQQVNSIPVSIRATVEGPLIATPAAIYLGTVISGSSSTFTVKLKAQSADVHVSSISTPEGLTVSCTSSSDSRERFLHLRWVAGKRLGRVEGHIDLEVDAPTKGLLRIPFLGLVEHE